MQINSRSRLRLVKLLFFVSELNVDVLLYAAVISMDNDECQSANVDSKDAMIKIYADIIKASI